MARKITQLESNYVNLDRLPRKNNGKIDWLKSINCDIDFVYCNISGIIKITNVKREKDITILAITYGDKTIDIKTANLKRCQLGKLLACNDADNILIKWFYNIGDNIIDDLYIIDRKIINAKQYYKISCKRCGFKSQGHYVVKNKELKHIDEYWCLVTTLKELKGCPCCFEKKSSIVVTGINDIETTDPWMVEYFANKDDVKKYSSCSNFPILMKCPDCGYERLYEPSSLKTYTHLPCSCNDNYSLPNKFSYFVFKEMKNIQNYQREYNPDWLKPYSYDNYFEYKNKKFVVEMDGALGHGKKTFGSNKRDVDGLKRDNIKDALAKEHNITVIRIDSEKSDLNYLKENMLKTLSNIVDLSTVDWQYVYEKATSNIVKNVCEYAKENYKFVGNKKIESNYIEDISLKFDIAKPTVVRFLKIGRDLGWCTYITCWERSKTIEDKVYELYQQDRNQGYEDIARKLGVEIWDVANATNKLIKNNKIIARRKYVQNKGN